MTCLRKRRVLLFLVVGLFVLGHSDQMFGKFHSHHHGAPAAATEHDHHGWDHHGDPGDQQKEADHMADHEAFAAVVPMLVVHVVLELHVLSGVIIDPARSPEPRAAGIDHPPQLA